jgi:hypothetical protein
MMQGSLGGLVSGESVWFPPTTWGVWLIEGISGNGFSVRGRGLSCRSMNLATGGSNRYIN